MNPQDFFKTYAPAARAVCHGTGLLTSVCLAQAALESNYGESGLTRRGNNFFGMKKSAAWQGDVITLPTKEQIPGRGMVTVLAAFKKYPTAEAAFADRVALFRRLERYKRLFRVDTVASESRLLLESGYCTDLKYPEKLVAIVTRYGLTKYDA